MGLTQAAIHRSRVTITCLIIIIVGGLTSYSNFSRSEDPQITIRDALVMTYFPGADAIRMENLVSDKIEKKIQEIPEVDHVTSENRTGISIITVEVKEEFKDMNPIWDELRDKVEEAESELPEGTSKPFVWDDFGDVYGIVYTLTGDGFSYRELKDIADDIRKELILVPDVAKVEIYGIQEERVFVEISNARLAAFGLTPSQVFQQLADQNIILPGGSVHVGRENVTVEPSGDYQSVEEIRRTIISVPGSMNVVYLEDIGKVYRGYIDPPTTMMRFDGKPSLGLAISMSEGGNIVDLGKNTHELMQYFEANLPVGIQFGVNNYQPEDVTRATNDFMLNLVQAILIVCLVMLVSLGARTGIIVSTLIPMTVLLTFTLMYFFGIDFQRVSIASLIIALGLMVDCGIVMAESILVRMESGQKPLEACVATGKQLSTPLLMSTLTTIAAFLPVGIAKSVVGEYCISLFQVVSLSLLSSWLLGLVMIPFLCFHFLKGHEEKLRFFDNKIVRLVLILFLFGVGLFIAKVPPFILVILAPLYFLRFLAPKKQKEPDVKAAAPYTGGFYNYYRQFLKFVLTKRLMALGLLIGIFAVSLYAFSFVKVIFFPPSDRAQFVVEFWMPEGTHVEATSEYVKMLERFLDEQPEVKNYTAYVGSGGPRFFLSFGPEQVNENFAFFLINGQSYPDVLKVLPRVKTYLQKNAVYANPIVKQLESGAAVGDPVQVRISGKDLETLDRLNAQVKQLMARTPGTLSIKDDWGTPVKKLVVDVKQDRAKRVGLSSRDIAYSLNMQYDGEETTQYREEDEIIPIVVRSDDAKRTDIGKIEGLNVYSFSGEGGSIPLAQLAETRLEWTRAKIYRRDRQRTITVSCQVKDGYFASDIFKALEKEMQPLSKDWPFGYKYEYGGQDEESAKANKSIMDQLPLALIIIAFLMILQFNSFGRVAIIFGLIRRTLRPKSAYPRHPC